MMLLHCLHIVMLYRCIQWGSMSVHHHRLCHTGVLIYWYHPVYCHSLMRSALHTLLTTSSNIANTASTAFLPVSDRKGEEAAGY